MKVTRSRCRRTSRALTTGPACPSRSRATSRSTARTERARSAPASAFSWWSTATWSFPTHRCPCARARSRPRAGTVSKYFGIDMDKPWSKVSKQHREVLLNGTGDKKIRFGYKNQYGHERWYEAPFEGVVANLQRRYEETQSDFLKAELERYMSDK